MALPAGRYGVTKNQLLKIKKLPMNTMKLIEELAEKYDLLGTAAYKNSTSVVTDSTDLVESGAVYDVVKGSVGFVTTGKNLLNNTAIDKSTSDLSFTVNADKSVTINGTATANRILALNNNFDSTALAGCLANGLSNISGLSYRVTTNDYATTYQTIDEDDTAIIDNGSGLSFYIRVANGTVCDNVTIYPMIRRADIIDSTYEPYHASVDESKADNSVIGTVEGANASKAWSVGEHFIKDGQFKEVTNPIASGEAINSGNTTDKPIADCLVKYARFSGVTTQYGGLEIDSLGKKIPVSAISDSGNQLCFFFKDNGKLYLNMRNRPDMSLVQNTTVSGTFYYI